MTVSRDNSIAPVFNICENCSPAANERAAGRRSARIKGRYRRTIIHQLVDAPENIAPSGTTGPCKIGRVFADEEELVLMMACGLEIRDLEVKILAVAVSGNAGYRGPATTPPAKNAPRLSPNLSFM